MTISIEDKEAQWLAVACARAQDKFPAGSKESRAFERTLQHIVTALELCKKVRHAKN